MSKTTASSFSGVYSEGVFMSAVFISSRYVVGPYFSLPDNGPAVLIFGED
jgi:hypothetical protein